MTAAVPARANLVSLFCTDHVALSDWYSSTFGWPELTDLTSEWFVALDAGPLAVGFHHDHAYDLLDLGGERAATGTRVHLTLDAGDDATIDAALGALAAAGAVIVKEPFTTYYGARQIVFRDPEGNVMRLSSSQPALT